MTPSPYVFLTVSGIGRLVAGALTPLLALLVTQSFSIDTLATCVIAAAVVRLCLTPLLGPLVDRTNPLSLLLRTEFALALLSAATAAWLLLGPVSATQWVLFFIANAVIQSIQGPAFPKVVMGIVAREELTSFTARETAIFSFARFGGPVLTGLFLLVWPTERALLFVLMAPSLVTLPVYWMMRRRLGMSFTVKAQAGGEGNTIGRMFGNWLHEVAAGFRFRWSIVTERYLGLQVFLELAVIVPTFGILLPYIVTDRKWSNSWLGWLEAASGAGLVIGSILAPRAMNVVGKWPLCIGSAFALAAGVFACAACVAFNNAYGLGGALFIANLALAFRMQAGAAQRRVAIPDRLRARVAGVHLTLNALAAQIGVAAAAAWLVSFSPSAWFVLSGVLLLLLALTMPLVPGFRELVSLDMAGATGFYERRFPSAFAGETQADARS
jgi:MFS family permease